MKQKKESYFWTSYSDLMTSLFFVMLVLFVLVIVLLHSRNKATEEQLKAIKEVVNSTKELQNDNTYFSYRDDYKKYVLNIKCQFPTNGASIDMLSKETKDSLAEAGTIIKKFLDKHNKNQYLVIVEGQASRNTKKWTMHNYYLSFERAMSLISLWRTNNIEFGTNCELQIAGSGDGRLNFETMRDEFERNNQRFLIYIIPKNIIQGE